MSTAWGLEKPILATLLFACVLTWKNDARAQRAPAAATKVPNTGISFSAGMYGGIGGRGGNTTVLEYGGRIGLRLNIIQFGILAERGVGLPAPGYTNFLGGLGLGYSYRGFRFAGMGIGGIVRNDAVQGTQTEKRPDVPATSGMGLGGWGEITHGWYNDETGAAIELGIFSQYRFDRMERVSTSTLTSGLLLGLRYH